MTRLLRAMLREPEHPAGDLIGICSAIIVGYLAVCAAPLVWEPRHVNTAAAGTVMLVDQWEPAAIHPRGYP